MAKVLWTQKQDMGPRPRIGHAMTYDAPRRRVVLFGGDARVGQPFGRAPDAPLPAVTVDAGRNR